MMGKVAYIVSRFPHLPETFILREMNALQARGIDVELFPLIVQDQAVMHTDARPWLDRMHRISLFTGKTLKSNLGMLLRRPGRYLTTFLQVVWHNLPSPKFLARAIYIFPCAVRMAEEMNSLGISHIHAHYATHPALAAWIAARFTDIPYSVSVHAHDIYVERSMLKQKLEKAAFIRAISAFNKQFLIDQLGIWIAPKTFVIHCGIQAERYAAGKKKNSGEFRIISVGSLQEYKGHEFLIRTCRILKDSGTAYQCTIAGGGELKGMLGNLIAQLGLTGEVHLAGAQTEENVAKLLKEADCFALASIVTRTGKMEGIPVVLMEALACGLPVVASDISGIPELIEDQKTGLLCEPKDAQAIAEAIQWVQTHPEEAARMAKAGRRKVREEFNLETSVKELSDLFSKFEKLAGER
jgi:glycosyltransferase involved in cell wall biosynthesis